MSLSICIMIICLHICLISCLAICSFWAENKLLSLQCLMWCLYSVQFSSVPHLCPALCDPMNRSMPGLPVHHQLPEFTQTHVHRVGEMPSSHLILCHPLLLLPSNSPRIRVFPNESTLHMRWPNYWSFSFSISTSNEHPRLISFRMDWLDLLEFKGLSRVFSNTTVQKHQFFSTQLSSQSNSHSSTGI